MAFKPAPRQLEPARTGRRHSLPGDDAIARVHVYLHAGQVFASSEPASIVTILGSCVAVCLFDVGAQVGGMNHFLLPHPVHREASPRFGSVAIAQLVSEVQQRGGRRAHLKAKVFGGAGLLSAFAARNLGMQNAALALRTLQDQGIPVVEEHLGGTRGRKLVFHTDTSNAWMKCL